MTMLKNKTCICLTVIFWALSCGSAQAIDKRPNILIITVDDMNADSIGSFGCPLKGTSPSMDRLAKSSLVFTRAHVQVGNCMPSRNVMWSGRYPHNNGVEGFYQVKDANFPTLTTLMQKAGYFTAIRHKVTHSTPFHPYPWDLVLDETPAGIQRHVKDADSYGDSTQQGIEAAQKAGKPFCLMINIADPHKPFYAQGKGGITIADKHIPSRVFKAAEVPVPKFLFEDPAVRKELAHYYSSVRRCDDAVGSILKALDESGKADETFVMFLSDHGMPLPFAKTQLYHHSTHTPLMIRWPGVTESGKQDIQHMVSAVDFLPTLLDVAGVKHPENLDGRSFASILRGKSQAGRDQVFKEYNENAGASRDPMRAIQTRKYLYLFNPWSNGKRVFATATSGTPTYRRLVKLAENNSALKQRLDLYKHRVVEELYDVENDPDCLINLMESAEHQAAIQSLRSKLESWMRETGDPILPVFLKREDPAAREAFVVAQEKEAMARKQKSKQTRKGQPKKSRKLIKLTVADQAIAGSSYSVTIEHKVPQSMGEQQVHVTLKGGKEGKRMERKVIKVTGFGRKVVEFKIPSKVEDSVIRIAAFVGKSYAENLQHLSTPPMRVR